MAGRAQQEPPSADRRRLEQEIAHYRNCENVHDLPEIFHYWSHHYLLPKLQDCGFEGVDDFFLKGIIEACRSEAGSTSRILSVGAGNCDLEVRLAALLRERGATNFRFHCVELNPHMVARGQVLARDAGLADRFTFEITNLDSWSPGRSYDVCIANHSLHHVVELERLFAGIKSALGEHGVFLINDMIGRNGHMRWPEALDVVKEIWSRMPQRYKYNHQLRRWEYEFDDWDCSKEGNEGIRAQDILPLLVETFDFDTFIAFANIIDVFVDRSFGHNFDPQRPEDVAFIDEVARIDESKLDAGEVTPTHLIAAARTRRSLRCYRHWTPEFCMRRPDA